MTTASPTQEAPTRRSWILKPTSSQPTEVRGAAAVKESTNTSDEERRDDVQMEGEYALEGSPSKPADKFLIQRYGYQEAKFLRQTYLTQKMQEDNIPSPLKDLRQGQQQSSAFKIPVQKSSAAFANDFLAMGQSQDSSDCNYNQGGQRSAGIASPETPCTSSNVYALTAQRRKPGRPRTRPEVLRQPTTSAVPSSVPDIDDQSLGGLLRRTVYHFIQTGKYDDLRFCVSEQSVSGQQINERLKQKMDQSLETFKVGPQVAAQRQQNKILQKDDQSKYSKQVVNKLLEGFQEWQSDSRKVELRLKKVLKVKPKKLRNKIEMPNGLMSQFQKHLQQIKGQQCVIKMKGQLQDNEVSIVVPRKPTPCSISIEGSDTSVVADTNTQEFSSDDAQV